MITVHQRSITDSVIDEKDPVSPSSKGDIRIANDLVSTLRMNDRKQRRLLPEDILRPHRKRTSY
jgi:hypothetical protein